MKMKRISAKTIMSAVLVITRLDSFYKLLIVMKDTQSNVCIQFISDGIPSELMTQFNVRSDRVRDILTLVSLL